MKISNISLVAVAALGMALAGCGNGGGTADQGSTTTTTTGGTATTASNVSGPVVLDGSSTVYPIAQAMAEDFKNQNSGVQMTVNSSGTGSGFQKFIRGESDICTASRPVEAKEDADLKAKGIDYVEIPIAMDGLSILVNPANTWCTQLTTADLKKIWMPNSTVKMWSDINPSFPKEKIALYGPSDNHGTFDYFTEAIMGKKGDIRKDYQANQDYNSIINAVAGDKDAIAFMAYNYYAENKNKVKALLINGVAPTPDTVAGGTYTPLSRPLFLYVSKKSLSDKPQVKAFVDFALNKDLDAVTEADYVKLPDPVYTAVRNRVTGMTTGSLFMTAKPGTNISEVVK